MNRSYIILLIIIIICGLLVGCRSPRDNRLTEISNLVTDNPQEALNLLGEIAYDSLSVSDRHYYDFLTIKANDKAYNLHTSDSLILDVIDYAASHKSEGYYAEALYYGGRVYSDIGDCPSALRYFQAALDALPDDPKDIDLKTRILSQTGRLLNVLHLPDEAIRHISSVIDIKRERNDTIGMIQNLQLLGHTYITARQFDKAQISLKEALRLGSRYRNSEDLLSKMYLAQAKYKIGEIDSALLLIRNAPEKSDSIERNSALAYACNIYISMQES